MMEKFGKICFPQVVCAEMWSCNPRKISYPLSYDGVNTV